MSEPPNLLVDSPKARLEARRVLREFGVSSLIVGDVLWVYDPDGQRMRVNDGERLVYKRGAFMVEKAEAA